MTPRGVELRSAASPVVLLATRNDAKLAELRRIVAALGLEEVRIVGLDEVEPFDEAPETGAAAAAHADGREVVVTERWPGRLVRAPRGPNGFGYDPAFVPEGETRSSAEMSPAEKDAVSHRARAFRALAPELRSLLT